jgi:ketosteroid isomerase-like protein
MSEENVEAFKRVAQAFNRRDLDGATEGLSPEVVFEPRAAAIEGNLSGRDGVRSFLAGLLDLFEVFELRYSDVRDLGDRVLALGTTRSIAKGSGIEQVFTIAVVATFKDGLQTHWKDYGDEAQALEAAGLEE